MASDNDTAQSRYRLGSTPRGDLIFFDGARGIEIGVMTRRLAEGVEIVLFGNSLRQWQYPHQDDPLTQEIKDEILYQAARLLTAQDARARPKIEW